jgi:hypothetical protein
VLVFLLPVSGYVIFLKKKKQQRWLKMKIDLYYDYEKGNTYFITLEDLKF